MKFIVTGAQIIGRALTRAVQQEYNASQQAAQARSSTSSGSDGKRQAASDAMSGMSISVRCKSHLSAFSKKYPRIF